MLRHEKEKDYLKRFSAAENKKARLKTGFSALNLTYTNLEIKIETESSKPKSI